MAGFGSVVMRGPWSVSAVVHPHYPVEQLPGDAKAGNDLVLGLTGPVPPDDLCVEAGLEFSAFLGAGGLCSPMGLKLVEGHISVSVLAAVVTNYQVKMEDYQLTLLDLKSKVFKPSTYAFV